VISSGQSGRKRTTSRSSLQIRCRSSGARSSKASLTMPAQDFVREPIVLYRLAPPAGFIAHSSPPVIVYDRWGWRFLRIFFRRPRPRAGVPDRGILHSEPLPSSCLARKFRI